MVAGRPSRIGRLVLGIIALLFSVGNVANVNAAGPPIVPNDQFGVDFVSAPGTPFSNQSTRYFETAQAGAAWNRWPLYWSNLESLCNGAYDWTQSDSVVNGDAAQGLKIDAILMGTPYCYATTYPTTAILPRVETRHGGLTTLSLDSRSAPLNLYLSTFADGTDLWAPGKAVNPSNYWARFVNATVARYHGQIQNWEIWNEPDNTGFWTASLADYVRLLKVGYLAAHAADSSARILVGGMMYWQWANLYGSQSWLKQFLGLVTSDSTAAGNGYYFDVIPWHFYSRSSDVYNNILSAQSVLSSYGLGAKELWLNETNVPACNDPTPPYATVSCGSGSSFPPGFATIDEQASFIIQAIAYAFDVGVKRVFEFQLQDDGNGEAFGMYRNDGTVRPVYAAYQLTAQYVAGYKTVRRGVANGAEQITFGVPGANAHRTTILWNDTGQTVSATVAAAGAVPTSVNVIQQTGSLQSIPAGSTYSLSLAPATNNRNYDVPWNPTDYTIGGPTQFLVENLPNDTTPPVSSIGALPSTLSPLSFQVTWSGSDPGGWGLFDYTIQYNDTTAGGGWVSWLTNTTSTSAWFSPAANHVYEFRSLARDWAGNVESKGLNQSDTVTTTSGPVYVVRLPVLASAATAGW